MPRCSHDPPRTPAPLKPRFRLTRSLPHNSVWTHTGETQREVGGGHFLRNVLGKGSQAHKTTDVEFQGYNLQSRWAVGQSPGAGRGGERGGGSAGHKRTRENLPGLMDVL